MEKFKLSVIIPIYNAELTLEETVLSVISQLTDSYEMILVDDGSTDDSLVICNKIQKTYHNVKVIHQENAGSLAARIRGAKCSEGEYILYLDADDVILPEGIELIDENIKKYHADIYIYDFLMDKIGGKESAVRKLLDYTDVMSWNRTNKKEIMSFFYDGKLNNIATTIVKRKVLYNALKVQNERKIKNGEDRLQLLYALLESDIIMYIPECFYYYKWQEGSQGSAERLGNAKPYMYYDFKAVWTHEREYYSTIGFSKDECIQYDVKMLNRIATLIEGILGADRELTVKEKCQFIYELSNDDFFLELVKDNVILKLRFYVKNVINLTKRGRVIELKIYIVLCKIIKILRRKYFYIKRK